MKDYEIDDLPQWHYGETKEEADRLAAEILSGKRKALITMFTGDEFGMEDLEEAYDYSNEELQDLISENRDMYPKKGDINVLTNWAGEPQCVIRTKGFGLMHYGDIPLEVAELELGDTDLDTWQDRKEKELLEKYPEDMIHSKTILMIEIIEVLEKIAFH